MLNKVRMIPHKAEPKFKMYGGLPFLHFMPEALRTMEIYIEACSTEVGWLGIVEQVGTVDFICSEVHLLQQEVNGGTTEISPDGLAAFAMEVGMEAQQHARLWGHSHADMGTFASGQDDSQMSLFKDNGFDWYFRIICNKKGSISVSYYNFESGYQIDDVAWDMYVQTSVTEEAVLAEIQEKVRKKTYPLVNEFGTRGNSQGSTSTTTGTRLPTTQMRSGGSSTTKWNSRGMSRRERKEAKRRQNRGSRGVEPHYIEVLDQMDIANICDVICDSFQYGLISRFVKNTMDGSNILIVDNIMEYYSLSWPQLQRLISDYFDEEGSYIGLEDEK